MTMAFNNPLPLTSITMFLFNFFLSSVRNISPSSKALLAKFSSSRISRAAIATLDPNGLPPKVEPCVPGNKKGHICTVTS